MNPFNDERAIYTIGHSNRDLKRFQDLLKNFSIELLVDVRRWPSSRRYPHFNKDYLQNILEDDGIEYLWYGDVLGGYRRFNVDVEYMEISCFKSDGFKAYAAYITSSDTVKNILYSLYNTVVARRSVLMCSELMPYKCHRKILSDWFLIKGFKVYHIIDLDNLIEHRLSKCAYNVDGELRYK